MSRDPENQHPRGRNNDDHVRSNNDQRRYKVANTRRNGDAQREKENESRSSWSSGLSSIDYDRNAE
jgi:hypothetical protein